MNHTVNDTYCAEDFGFRELGQILLEILLDPWIRIGEAEQRDIVFKCCVAFCIGLITILLNSVYHLLPILLRLLAVPALLYWGYLIAQRVVFPYIIDKVQSYTVRQQTTNSEVRP